MIRKAQPEDVESLYQLEQAVFGEAEATLKETFEKIVSYPEGHELQVLLYQGNFAGFYCVTWDEAEAYLSDLALHPSYQGHGLGSFLLEHCLKLLREKNCRRLFLTVRPSNSRALSLYRRQGFEQLEILKAYYGDEDGLRLFYKF